jgi:hypothetical protein
VHVTVVAARLRRGRAVPASTPARALEAKSTTRSIVVMTTWKY